MRRKFCDLPVSCSIPWSRSHLSLLRALSFLKAIIWEQQIEWTSCWKVCLQALTQDRSTATTNIIATATATATIAQTTHQLAYISYNLSTRRARDHIRVSSFTAQLEPFDTKVEMRAKVVNWRLCDSFERISISDCIVAVQFLWVFCWWIKGESESERKLNRLSKMESG